MVFRTAVFLSIVKAFVIIAVVCNKISSDLENYSEIPEKGGILECEMSIYLLAPGTN